MHAGKTARSRSPQQTQQDGLGLIVARVAKRDVVGSKMTPGALEELVARAMRGVLDRLPIPLGARSDIRRFDENLTAERLGHSRGKRGVAIGGRPELMIEMRDPGKRQIARAIELMKKARERDRVRPARHRRDNARSGSDQIVLTNKRADAFDHGLDWRVGLVGRVGW
jgi:hypothetical protein